MNQQLELETARPVSQQIEVTGLQGLGAVAVVPPAGQVSVSAPAVTPSELIRLALQAGDTDVARLERLMVMDEAYRKRQAELAFRRDFAAFRGENIIVPKTKEVDRGKAGGFTQAEFHVAAGMLSPALSKHGFGFRHDQKFGARRWVTDGVESDVAWVMVTCYLEHRDGHAETLTLEGPPAELGGNTAVQNMQATASYLKRQSLLAITGTATGDEDDESRMRRGDGGGQRKKVGEQDEAAASRLVDTGNAEAEKGTQALDSWWQGLKQSERDLVTPYFGAMKAAARRATKR